MRDRARAGGPRGAGEWRGVAFGGGVQGAGENPAPDPIVYLDGGPGGNSLETIGLAFDSLIDPYLDERDFVLFDQRGAGSTRRWTARAGRG